MGRVKNCVKVLVENTEQKYLLGRPRQVILKGILKILNILFSV
jgi:hypothetical protein